MTPSPVQLELPMAPLVHPERGSGRLTIQQRFEAFHELNPWILDRLEGMTADCLERGMDRVGIGMLFEVLRWEYGRATTGDTWRLNNDYRSRYARLLLDRHPEWSPAFELRGLRTA
ncbi:hypothetical protein ACN20G_33325 (plasmid) [Streptomyces sp. BI20]|uniref:hypothetical protein n=1 Tax=Streptomyces sp. BI20 TaxID=3403460 RepID=UPI003C71B4DF